MTAPARRALFVDRDGTIIHDAHYLRDAAQVELLPGAVEFLRAFAAAGWLIVVVTNQSGIARGTNLIHDGPSMLETARWLRGELIAKGVMAAP